MLFSSGLGVPLYIWILAFIADKLVASKDLFVGATSKVVVSSVHNMQEKKERKFAHGQIN